MADIEIQTVSGVIKVGGEGSTVSTFKGQPVVVSTTSGLLFCRKHKKPWCQDIEIATGTRQDYESIRIDLNLMMVNTIIVPLIPTLRVYASVHIETAKKSGVLKCYLDEPADDPENAPQSLFLGMLAPFEGRRQMRTMIHQVLLPDMEDEVRTDCQSLRHNLMRNVAMVQQSRDDKRVKIANAWTMKWYSKCMLCLGEEGPGMKFASDLVPEG